MPSRYGFGAHDGLLPTRRGIELEVNMLEQEKVESALGEIRMSLKADGGDVEFVRIEGNRVHVRLMGACAGCPMRDMTLKNGIEKYLKEKVPGVEEVVSV